MPLPEAPADAQDLIFTSTSEEIRTVPGRAVPPPPRPTSKILEEVARMPAERSAGIRTGGISLFPEIAEAEYEAMLQQNILREIIDDPEAAYRPVAVLYQDFLVRCRICRVPGAPPDLAAFRRRLVVAQAGIDEEAADDEAWQ